MDTIEFLQSFGDAKVKLRRPNFERIVSWVIRILFSYVIKWRGSLENTLPGLVFENELFDWEKPGTEIPLHYYLQSKQL